MKVKICGFTEPSDAIHAAQCGSDYVGIIFAKESKRVVCLSQAKEIIAAISHFEAEPVAVFKEQSCNEIIDICTALGIKTVQLHGDSRESLLMLQRDYAIFYAINGDAAAYPKCKYLLFDAPHSGQGKAFDWNTFSPPQNRPWFLAGGLNPANVEKAIRLLQPAGVDVASGVELSHCVRKDPKRVEVFIHHAKKIEGEI